MAAEIESGGTSRHRYIDIFNLFSSLKISALDFINLLNYTRARKYGLNIFRFEVS